MSDYVYKFSDEQLLEAASGLKGLAGCTLRSGQYVDTARLADFALAMKERAEKAEDERDALTIALYSWHSVFGTTQLTHARARLENAEIAARRRARERAK